MAIYSSIQTWKFHGQRSLAVHGVTKSWTQLRSPTGLENKLESNKKTEKTLSMDITRWSTSKPD